MDKTIEKNEEIMEQAQSVETVEDAKRYGADKFFFSAGGITPDGKMKSADFDNHILLIRAMMENSKQKFLLFDHEKISDSFNKYLGSLADVNTVITDFVFDKEVKEKYPLTNFIEL